MQKYETYTSPCRCTLLLSGNKGHYSRVEFRCASTGAPQPADRDSDSQMRANTGVPSVCLAQELGHPEIRDPRRSQGCRIGVTHCKHGGTGVGDKFCTPILGEHADAWSWGAGEGESGAGMRFAPAFCALPGLRNGHGVTDLIAVVSWGTVRAALSSERYDAGG